MHPKQVIWVGTAKKDLKKLPNPVQQEIGYHLYREQVNDRTKYTKKLRGVSSKVYEVVSNYNTNTYRAVYTTELTHYIYVLHCFNKKSTRGIKTPKRDVALIKERLYEAKTHHKMLQKNS